MPRLARLVVPGLAHHVTQRGNRRQVVFFSDADRRCYLRWLAEACRRFGVQIWAYCLMSNHIHLVAVPQHRESLARCLGDVHTRYARRINLREGWSGHVWQARFGSSVMDAAYTIAAVRYVEQNPVRAGLVVQAWEYRWSSARYHVGEAPADRLVCGDEGLRSDVGDWRTFLQVPPAPDDLARIRRDTPVCWPLGAEDFVRALETGHGLRLQRGRAGRPRLRN